MKDYQIITVLTQGGGKIPRVYLDGKRRDWPITSLSLANGISGRDTGRIITIRVPRNRVLRRVVILDIAVIVLALSGIVMILLR